LCSILFVNADMLIDGECLENPGQRSWSGSLDISHPYITRFRFSNW